MKKLTKLINAIMGVAFCVIPVTTDPVSMKLRSEPFLKSWEYINFYGDTFKTFYRCLSSKETVRCSAGLTRDVKQPSSRNEWRVEDLHKAATNGVHENVSNYFSCQFPFPEKYLTCRRLQLLEVICEPTTTTQHFRLWNPSAPFLPCVAFIWNSLGEYLVFDSNAHILELCGDGCNSSSKTTSTTNNPIQHTQPSPRHEHDHDDDHHDNDDDYHDPHKTRPRHPIDDHLDTKSHIILAVVIGLIVVAILVIAAAFFRKKLLQQRLPVKRDDEFDKATSRRKKSSRSVMTASVITRSISIEVTPRSSSVVLDPSRLNTDI